jgi:hypothetical protein
MRSTQRKLECCAVLAAGSLVLTAAVLVILSDSHSDSTPPSMLIQRKAYQIHWQQPAPLQSEGIESAERINEQMMRQRYQDHCKRLEQLR